MDYSKFQKIAPALGRYIMKHYSVMCSPKKIQEHLLVNITYEQAQNITQHYRLYLEDKYSLNRLILMIIIYKYGCNEIFENVRGDRARMTYLTEYKNLNDKIGALDKFMQKY